MADQKISALSNMSSLTGTEKLTGLQSGVNKNTTPAEVFTYTSNQLETTGVPSLAFTGGVLSVGPDGSNNFAIRNTGSQAGALFIVNWGATDDFVGFFGATSSNFQFYCGSSAQTVSFENCGGVDFNFSQVIDLNGDILDSNGLVFLSRTNGQQAAIADATGAGDVVAQLNSALAALRALGVIAT